MRYAVMIGDEPHGMARFLHRHSRVDHQPLSTADAQIWVQERHVQFHREISSIQNMYLIDKRTRNKRTWHYVISLRKRDKRQACNSYSLRSAVATRKLADQSS